MLCVLYGQVYKIQKGTFERDGETRSYVSFRLGIPKPYKTQKEVDGETRAVREKTFVSCRIFNGMADIFAQNVREGQWVQLIGHFAENNFTRDVDVEHPQTGKIFTVGVPTRELQFIVQNFYFAGSAPQQQQQQDGKPRLKLVAREKEAEPVPVAVAAEDNPFEEFEEGDVPF